MTLAALVVVSGSYSNRGRTYGTEAAFDVFIESESAFLGLIKRHSQPIVVEVLEVAETIYGDKSVEQRLRAAAESARRTPRVYPRAALLRAHCEPFDYLRHFEAIRENGSPDVAFVISMVIKATSEAFLVRRGISVANPTGLLTMLKAVFPRAASLANAILQLPAAQVCVEPEVLRDFVRLLLGDERRSDEWLNPPAKANISIPSIHVAKRQLEARFGVPNAARAARAYSTTLKGEA